MNDLIDLFLHYLEECHPRGESYEYHMQNQKTEKIYDSLKALLNDEQKEKLHLLSNEYFMQQGCDANENFIYGFKTAFKFIFQTLII